MTRTTVCLLTLAAALCGCANHRDEATPVPARLWNDARPALESINAADALNHIRTLASDEFEGRAPGSRGEELSVAYLTNEFKRLGLQPGNPDGSYVQNVPLVGITPTNPSLSFTVGGRTVSLHYLDDFVAVSRRVQPQIDVDNSDIVFVGYGVVAPEYGWDDYKGVDVRGKTILMLINDPAVPDPKDPSRLDPDMFKGNAMTYYGRWTYKYEIAAQKGAAAAIIIHETGPAGYPYAVVSGSWGRENFDIKSPSGNAERAQIESWITLDKAKQLLSAAGQDFDALKRSAVRKDFRPVALNAKASFHVTNVIREVQSRNVVAKLEGDDHKDEYVTYSAHWDHLGKNPELQGDQIYNGALDNATGVAALLELAKAYTKLPHRPDRTILFLAVTAEEQGLLGARYYAENPLYPLRKTLANINMDGMNTWGRTKDVVVIGYGNSTLDDVLAQAASHQNRVIAPDPEPEKGFFYRSDHFEFAKQGVPALDTDEGVLFIGKPAGYGEQKRNEYTNNDYHKPSDEVKPDWDLSGFVEDTQLLFMVGYSVAQGEHWPEWKAGTEFKARREAMLR